MRKPHGRIAMDFALTDEQRLIHDYGDHVARSFDRAYWMRCAERGEPPAELRRRIADDGFMGLMVPEAHGGAGQGLLEMLLFVEGLSNHGIPLLNLVVGATMTMGLIARHGTSEQQRRFLPAGCRGELSFCFAITEPDAGSNSIRIKTRARPDGRGGLLLSGQKVFITDADRADYALVVARTTPLEEAARKTDGFSLLMVDMRHPNVRKTPIPMSFPLPETQSQVFFDDVPVAAEDVVGELGQGFRILFDSLNPERVLVAGICAGIGRHALRRAVAYAGERKVFNDTPIGAYQGLQHPLAMAHTEIELAALMARRAAWAYDRGDASGGDANMAKYAAAEAGVHAVDVAIQTFGGNGFAREYGLYDLYGLVRLLRTAPLARELLLSYIGEHVMGLPRSY
jgi:acyl-CoA dehydrogenase